MTARLVIKKHESFSTLAKDWLRMGEKYVSVRPPRGMMRVAGALEFGTMRIPPRPFFRTALDTNRRHLGDFMAKLAVQVARKKLTPDEALHWLGRFTVEKVKERMASSRAWATPNAPSTIKRKGFNYPLVRTGKLLRGIHYVLQRGKRSRRARR